MRQDSTEAHSGGPPKEPRECFPEPEHVPYRRTASRCGGTSDRPARQQASKARQRAGSAAPPQRQPVLERRSEPNQAAEKTVARTGRRCEHGIVHSTDITRTDIL